MIQKFTISSYLFILFGTLLNENQAESVVELISKSLKFY